MTEQIGRCVQAWRELYTCRSFGMAMGPIPFTACLAWAEFHGLDHDATSLLWNVIRFLDGERSERVASKQRMERMRG